ncbi:quercetin 2,3-dioxygenase [Deinococcus geothermalis]|uniref:Quercetin 2,3-dioxygenase n=1 Tax=Deinococcus geothermalis (strain DSM 11300 / CIP 105573 / AG-3a) TaxID=319795 RepID=Q1J2S1_DEIGD|nr:quercetin 2,3-dioxygenase [Deinococcus geothermalis]ABF44213.1 Quercetin 2,3-dioxygenase [Deinococcus geothermalis DSM 11300]
MTSTSSATTLPATTTPYVLEAGGGTSGVLLGQTTRILVGGSQSNGALAVVVVLGPRDNPIPFHAHREARDTFFVTRGQMQLWADGESRILNPGDFAYVAPGTAHAYQFLGNYTETVGMITPGGWEEFFVFTSNPYGGPAFPPVDTTSPPFERLGRAQDLHDVSFRRDLTPFPAQTDRTDETLPEREQAYFLKADTGERHVMLGQICTVLAGGPQTSGALGMAMIEGPRGAKMPAHVHRETHEVLYVLGGRLRVTLDGAETVAYPGDCVNIPAGCVHSYVLEGRSTRFLTMNAKAGIDALFAVAGEPWPYPVFPDQSPAPGDQPDLARAEGTLDISFVL